MEAVKYSKKDREFFRRTGQEGGQTRAKNLSPEERKESARKAAQARWAKAKRG
jgi:hypothetical protein